MEGYHLTEILVADGKFLQTNADGTIEACQIKVEGPAKFSTRKYNRCKLCGRPHAYLRNYGVCRICFRELAYKGEIPGVRKASF